MLSKILKSITTLTLLFTVGLTTTYTIPSVGQQYSQEHRIPPSVSTGFADVVAPLMPAIVNISTVQKQKKPGHRGMNPLMEGAPLEDFGQFFEKFFPPGIFDDEPINNRKLISLGSGFIIDDDGHIATNYHVIADADEITVKLNSGLSLKAKLVGADKETDIALLKVNSKKKLPYLQFGDSDKARVGDWAIAVGNPFALGNTVTVGIVSANGRDISSEGMVDNFIQTDAAINRGNSGGPMFNIYGEVIGINTQILSPSGVNIGIGFATPSSIIIPVIKQLKTTGKVITGFLGIFMQPLTEDLAESMGLSNVKGALVTEVGKGTPAKEAGLETGDIITSFNNNSIKSTKELQREVRNSPIGKPLPMVVLRKGKQKTLTVKLKETSKSSSNIMEKFGEKFKAMPTPSNNKYILGAHVSKIDNDVRNKFGIPNSINGLIILDIKKRSGWDSQGFMKGNVLISMNGVELKSVEQLDTLIKDAKSSSKKSVSFLVQQKQLRLFMYLPLEE